MFSVEHEIFKNRVDRHDFSSHLEKMRVENSKERKDTGLYRRFFISFTSSHRCPRGIENRGETQGEGGEMCHGGREASYI